MPEIYCSPSGWLAEIFLRYEKRRDITRLVHREQQGPLMVQRPFYPEQGVSHTYLLHPPGGVVGGDVLKVGISVGEGAHALITTPGATKFYRSAGAIARQVQDLAIDKNGFLEWLPQENIFFPAATAALKTQISLTSTSRFIGWEIQCFGRPVLNEVFSSGLVTGHTQIRIDNKLILAESLYVDQLEQYRCAAGMRDFPMMGSLYISPSSPELFELIHECIARFCKRNKERLECGITDVDGLLVIRTLGYQTEPMMACFVSIWQAVRKHWLGYTPEPPRIWAT